MRVLQVLRRATTQQDWRLAMTADFAEDMPLDDIMQ
jgi:hypothetical protein